MGKSVGLSLQLYLRIPFLRGVTLRGWVNTSWRSSETFETIPHSHLCEKLKSFAFLILPHSDSFLQLIKPNPVLAVKCSLFHYATCFGPVDGQQLIVLKFLSDGTVVACSELTSVLLYCCIILGVCCTLTACHSSAPEGTSWLIFIGIFSFFPWRWHCRTETCRRVPSVGSCVHCGGCSCRCDYAMRTGGRFDIHA